MKKIQLLIIVGLVLFCTQAGAQSPPVSDTKRVAPRPPDPTTPSLPTTSPLTAIPTGAVNDVCGYSSFGEGGEYIIT